MYQAKLSKEESTRLLGGADDGHNEAYLDEKLEEVAPKAPLLRRLAGVIALAIMWLHARWTALRALSALGALQYITYSLLPSFARRSTDPNSPKSQQRLSSHAHLDGLRGLAALFVFFFHSSYTVWDVRAGFASGHKGEFMSPLRLPFLRLLFSGDAMVSIFYLVSGFVLSIKPVKHMESGSYESLFTLISSSAFRRGVRLFFPCFISTLIILVLLRLGIYEHTRPFALDASVFKGSMEWHMYRTDTLWEQMVGWMQQTWNFVHVWEWNDIYAGNTGFDVHLWTIPDEYRCSMLLFLTQILMGRGSHRARLILLATLTAFGAAWDRWDMMCFWLGAILAEVDVCRLERNIKLPHNSEQTVSESTELVRQTGWLMCFVSGLYLLSFPDSNPQKTFGYRTLYAMIPPTFSQPNRFWHVIGGAMTAHAINRLTPLQRIFNARPVIYLGKISFSLYLMHGLVLHTFGYTLLEFLLGTLGGRDSATMFTVAWTINQMFVTLAAIWAADLFWINVDMPSNKLCRWIEDVYIGKA